MKVALSIFFSISVLIVFSQNTPFCKSIDHDKFNFFELEKEYTNYFNQVDNNPRWKKQYLRWNYNVSKRMDKEGRVRDDNEMLKAYAEYQNNNPVESGNWSPLGPMEWQSSYNGFHPGNGRVNSVVVDPNNQDVMYCCAATGGLWKSNDGGKSWNTPNDDFPMYGVSDIAIDPNNSDVLYLATGDRDNYYHSYGVGVLKSTNGGLNWEPTGLYSTTLSKTRIVNCLEINSQNPNTIFAGTKLGLYKSVDAGKTWKMIKATDIREIKINTADTSMVYTAGYSNFFRSTDGGNSFSTILNGLPSSSEIGGIALDVTDANSDYVYLNICGKGFFSGEFIGVYKSTDGGLTFNQMVADENLNLLGDAFYGYDTFSQGSYCLSIAVSDINPNEVYTGGINVWKSIDGGVNWDRLSWAKYVDSSTYCHADIHSLDFYNNVLFTATDGGVYKYHEDAWVNLSRGLNIMQLYNFDNSESNRDKISAGAHDNGTNLYNGETWTHYMGADGMETIIDYDNEQIMYATYQQGNLWKTNNGGLNVSPIFSASYYNLPTYYVSPIAMSPINHEKIYIGCNDIYMNLKGGNGNWENITKLNAQEVFEIIRIAPSDDQYIYAQRGNNLLIRTKDGGTTWEDIPFSLQYYVTDIQVSKLNPELIYIAAQTSMSSKVFVSTNAGDSFTEIESALPNLGINTIALENNSVNGIYVGMGTGVFYKNDTINEWLNYSENLPTVKISELEVLNQFGLLRAATFGRGVWETRLFGNLVSINTSKAFKDLKIYPNPATSSITVSFIQKRYSKITLFNAAGYIVKECLISDIENNKSIDVAELVQGVYFVKLMANNGETLVEKFIKN